MAAKPSLLLVGWVMDAPPCAVVGAALVEVDEGLLTLLTPLVVEASVTPPVPPCSGAGAAASAVSAVGSLGVCDVEAGFPPLQGDQSSLCPPTQVRWPQEGEGELPTSRY